MTIPGILIFLFGCYINYKEKQLIKSGITIYAKYLGSSLQGGGSNFNTVTYFIECVWENPETGEINYFRSKDYDFDIGHRIKVKEIPVILNPKTGDYFVNLSEFGG